MRVTPTDLRKNLYRMLDRVIETGVPLEIDRDGTILRIVPPSNRGKLDDLEPREYLRGDPEDLVHLDWSEEWSP